MRDPALLLVLALAACSSRKTDDSPVRRLTLTNRTDAPVTGALLRFDRELVRADRIEGFAKALLRLARPDTLRVEGDPMPRGSRAVYEVEGTGGPPELLEGRWLRGDRLGPPLTKAEFAFR